MTYLLEDIIEETRIALDQNMTSEALAVDGIGDIDTLSLDELIRSKVEDAAFAVVMAAPVEMLGDIATSYSPALGDFDLSNDTGRYVAKVNLPLDFAKLIRAKLNTWNRPTMHVSLPNTPRYEQAQSAYSVLGTKERPAAFLVPGAHGQVLELYCAESSEGTLEECLYAKRPKIYKGITCVEAHEIGTKLADNTQTTNEYSVEGYITDTSDALVQMSDTQNGGNDFQIINYTLPTGVNSLTVGDRIVITGRIKKDAEEGVLMDGGDVEMYDESEVSDKIILGVQLHRPTIYYAAYLTALAVKDGDAAAALLATAKEMLGSGG